MQAGPPLVTGHTLVCRKLRSYEPGAWKAWLALPPEHADLPDRLADAQSLLAALVAQHLFLPATRLLAYGLPEREAVWWSCMCVRHTLPDHAAAEAAAVAAAEAWVRAPDLPARQAAAAAATAAGLEVPGAWSALGAAWSHRLRERPKICGGRGAAAAVERSVLRGDAVRPAQRQARLQRFIDSALDIGNGGAGRLAAEGAACP